MVTTFTGSVQGLKNDKRLNAQFNQPWGMCLSPHDGCLYVCDHANQAIRKVTMQGIWQLFPVIKQLKNLNNKGEVSTFAKITQPCGIVMNHKTKGFYVTGLSHAIFKVTDSGIIDVLC
jgi:hypothetical protein